MSVDEIIRRTSDFPAKHVCITGGEPLLQPETHTLMKALCDLGYVVSLETSGDLSCLTVDPRVRKIIDVKTPDSGAANRFNTENLTLGNVNTEFKFVICSEKDFWWAEDFVKSHALNAAHVIYYSPSFGVTDPAWLAEKILSENSSARLQLQLHKYIWSPEKRGV
jgi:7-carboxy-7-deazaguanine synthase